MIKNLAILTWMVLTVGYVVNFDELSFTMHAVAILILFSWGAVLFGFDRPSDSKRIMKK